MVWDEYEKRFLAIAKENNKSKKYCDKWLDYAKKLCDNNLPIIYNQEHLCLLLGYRKEYVYAAANSPKKFYRTFSIAKKSGGVRTISEPLPSLKEIQKWILENILERMAVSPFAKAYVKGKNIRENARFHRNQPRVLSLDLHDFFGQISSFLVFKIFIDAGYATDVSMLLTSLCCLSDRLPQGASTSAYLSNLVMKEFDDSMAKYVAENKIRYTRYADDMTFSGNIEVRNIIRFVRKNLKPYGLELNESKTRVRNGGQQQEVTGIVVNEKLQISKKKRKKIRQEIYYIKKYGLQSHLNYTDETRGDYLRCLEGRIRFALSINPNDHELREYLSYISEWC